MKYLIASCVFFLGVYGCKKSCPEKVDKDCVCIEIYDPVCGCNDKTYSNSCHAECSGITDYSKGECK